MKKTLFSFLIIVLMCVPASGKSEVEWRDVAPGNIIELPRDLYFQRDYRIQWWYFTGHLYDRAGREFGYELIFFAAGVQKRKYQSRFAVNTLYLSHFAISDIAGKHFYHYSNADAGAYGFADADSNRLHVWVDRNSLEGDIKSMRIRAEANDASIDLTLIPEKPVVLNGDHGYSRKSEESGLIASLYFSFTDLKTAGNLELKGDVFQVGGKSWFDREIASATVEKWDWFAVQLDNGQDIMLYRIRKKDGSSSAYSSGTFVYKDGTYRHLANSDFTIKVLEHHASEQTGTQYPSKWEIAIPSERLKLVITPLIKDQEFTETGGLVKPYWEGACSVEGSADGRAYVEMTGY